MVTFEEYECGSSIYRYALIRTLNSKNTVLIALQLRYFVRFISFSKHILTGILYKCTPPIQVLTGSNIFIFSNEREEPAI